MILRPVFKKDSLYRENNGMSQPDRSYMCQENYKAALFSILINILVSSLHATHHDCTLGSSQKKRVVFRAEPISSRNSFDLML